MALFWLRTSYHAHRYTFQRYMLRSLLTQSFNIVNTPVILLFSKKWDPEVRSVELTLAKMTFHDVQFANVSSTERPVSFGVSEPSLTPPRAS